jgi:type VI protein secretion system component VasF
MSVSVSDPFQKRIRRIARQRSKLRGGIRHKVTRTGLIVAKPRIIRPQFPLKSLMLMFVVALLFKGFVFYQLGADDYNARVNALANGTKVEQAGAYLMSPDPVSGVISDVMREIFG